ncbi:MAG: DUF1573 domain-containing protein [Desulfobacteraceae bacterium]|nr:DUF1573 domain-containing protein [Desulfobacteraceae bacterium]
MKKLSIILTVFWAVILFALPCTAAPRAVFVDSTFKFAPLPEGEKIIHEFVVRNTGDTPLSITNVLPP